MGTISQGRVSLIIEAIEAISSTAAPSASSVSPLKHNQWSVKHSNLSSSSTPKVDTYSAQSLTGASGTIDLTSLPIADNTAYDATDAKLIALFLDNQSDDNTVVVSKGSSNGYPINGASGNYTLKPGEQKLLWYDDEADVVSGTVKTIDYTNGATTKSLRMILMLGDQS